MPLLSLIYQKIVRLTRQVCQLPQVAAIAVRRRRQRQVWAEAEAERLDRIRNPSKYLGK